MRSPVASPSKATVLTLARSRDFHLAHASQSHMSHTHEDRKMTRHACATQSLRAIDPCAFLGVAHNSRQGCSWRYCFWGLRCSFVSNTRPSAMLHQLSRRAL